MTRQHLDEARLAPIMAARRTSAPDGEGGHVGDANQFQDRSGVPGAHAALGRALRARAQGDPAGLTHDSRTLLPYPIYVARASGPRKWDVDGNEYVDYFGGHGALLLGHSHPAVIEAVKRQVELGTHYGSTPRAGGALGRAGRAS